MEIIKGKGESVLCAGSCQRRERKVADRADVSEKQVDLSFFDCHAFERSCQCQALEVAGHVDGKIGNT